MNAKNAVDVPSNRSSGMSKIRPVSADHTTRSDPSSSETQLPMCATCCARSRWAIVSSGEGMRADYDGFGEVRSVKVRYIPIMNRADTRSRASELSEE